MSRRGRRQVLQLGDSSTSSKLHRYGYSKNFSTKDSLVQSQQKTLVGDYSDSDSEDNDDKKGNEYDVQDNDVPLQEPIHVPVEPEITPDVKNGAGDAMDDELRHFLSEIEAIPAPTDQVSSDQIEEEKSPLHANENHSVDDITRLDIHDTDNNSQSSFPVASSKRKVYSMFVKGDVEFSHSPTPSDTNESNDASMGKNCDSVKADTSLPELPEEPVTQWQMVKDDNTQYYYYWNWQTNEVTWEIPSDYTQYLLLHKEYEAKLAKIPPEQLQAIKDKKSSQDEASIKSNSTNGLSKPEKEPESANVEKGMIEKSLSLSDHHKKKKHKKHKRKHHSDSDEEMAKNTSTVDTVVVANQFIGPQPLSIVPYMSDNDDDDEEDENKEQEVNGRSNKSTSPGNRSTHTSTTLSQSTTVDVEALVEDLVKFHDSIAGQPSSDSIDKIENEENEKVGDKKESDVDMEVEASIPELKTTEEMKVSECKNVEENDLKNEDLKMRSSNEDLQNKSVSGHESTEEKLSSGSSNILSSKGGKKENIFEIFSEEKESKIVKLKKKKAINMFAEDSESDTHSENEKVESVIKSDVKVEEKIEMEEGEISDSVEQFSKPSKRVSNEISLVASAGFKDESKIEKDSDNSVIKDGVVDSEEEEGELKEEDSSTVKRKKQEELHKFKKIEKEEDSLTVKRKKWEESHKLKKTEKLEDGNTSSDNLKKKKKVLQYSDYKKKYGMTRTLNKSMDSVANSKLELEESSERISDASEVKTSSNANDNSVMKRESVERESTTKLAENDVSNDLVIEKTVSGGNNENTTKTEVEDDTKEEVDVTENMDFEDLDDIDRVLEMALVQKKDQKKITHDAKESDQSSEKSTVPVTEDINDKKEEKQVNSQSSPKEELHGTDLEQSKFLVKESVELALNKLQFLDISTKNLSRLQVLLIELQTRYADWNSGGLSTSYFHTQLQSAEALLLQYEDSAVPSGWICQWDRASCRYFYQNKQTHHTQWEYPQVQAIATGQGDGRGREREDDSRASSSKSKGGGESNSRNARKSSSNNKKRRRSKDREVPERDKERSLKVSSSSRGHSTGRSNRHHSSRKDKEKERSKRDKQSSSSLSHHHRKKKRRRREHSSDSNSSDDESSKSKQRHRSKRKKRERSDKSPSIEVIDSDDEIENAQVIEDSPSPSVRSVDKEPVKSVKDGQENKDSSADENSNDENPLASELSHLVADYGSDQDEDDNNDGDDDKIDNDDEQKKETKDSAVRDDLVSMNEDIDGEELNEGSGGDEPMQEDEEEAEEETNSAVIIRAPQIIVPPSYVAAVNQPQLYSAPALYAASTTASSTVAVTAMTATSIVPESNAETGTAIQNSEESVADKATTGAKKKKKDKSGKEKSLTTTSSIMMKKKGMSSMVQKWQKVKKEVEKENRDKEMRQAAIREKINELKKQ